VMTWVERKGAAYIQDRRGPNRADIFGIRAWGLFHPLADGLKFLFKEDFIPDNAHRLFYQLAPMFSLAPAILGIAVVPFGPDVTVMGRKVALQIADLNVGILYLFAVSGMAVYGVVLAGWSSGSKYPLLGGLRSSAQMMAYEVSMGISLIGIFMVFESVRMSSSASCRSGASSSSRSGSSSSSWPNTRRRTGLPSTCRKASRSWWPDTIPSTLPSSSRCS
jgi:NADH-quinone oxidoreductase subunit H